MRTFLDFEKPVAEIETMLEQLRQQDAEEGEPASGSGMLEEVTKLEARLDRLLRAAYAKLTPWQKVQVARHPERPHGLGYVNGLIEDFTPLAGDRAFGEDLALIGGLGRFRGIGVVVLAHEKGHDMATRVRHNFGMPRPEGYRKARRLMQLADRFGLPVLSFVDTAGAYPGIDAEARGQAEAIARAIEACLALTVPMVSVIIGEGGSGGAVAIATGNQVAMLEHAVYSVISPEGCASILWRSSEKAQEAAEALHVTAQDLARLRVIDRIIPEPVGGAHRDGPGTVKAVGNAVEIMLRPLMAQDGPSLKAARRIKFLEMGRHGL